MTNLKRIPRWFAPVTGTLEPGGHYAIEGTASGRITECERLSGFSLTWEFAGDVSWVEVRISNEGNEPHLTLTHTALLSPHWDEYGAGAAGVGWEMGFLGLALHIADPDAPKSDEMEFATSQDGRAFITGSSEGWSRQLSRPEWTLKKRAQPADGRQLSIRESPFDSLGDRHLEPIRSDERVA